MCDSRKVSGDDSFLKLAGGPGGEAFEVLDRILEESFFEEGERLVRTETWRLVGAGKVDPTEEEAAQNRVATRNLKALEAYLKERADEFNRLQRSIKLEHFVWPRREEWPEGEDSAPTHWLFGFRIGEGEKVISIITHLDTVPPGNSQWKPFEPRIEKRDYLGQETNFWAGRGTIDDKGPAVAAFSVLRAIAKTYDGTDKLKDITLEVLFDSSEETDMSTPQYLLDPTVKKPDFGIVFDAMWIIRAEKGSEWPVFTLDLGKQPTRGLWVESLRTPEHSSVNQIPDNAVAVIRGESSETARDFLQTVAQKYLDCPFDDPAYNRAKLTAELTDDETGIKLTTLVAGAQHGSAPQENREEGANPLVSMANFLAALGESRELGDNGYTRMCRFISWMWGTRVFGEAHPPLFAFDHIFEEGNGTTYAVTKIGPEQGKVRLGVDIRYAFKHHGRPLNEKEEGTLPGDSTFGQIFPKLVKEFNEQNPGLPVNVATATSVGPEYRRADNPNLLALKKAYEEAMKSPAPLIAIGGGTDSKGFPQLLAAGALFGKTLGPPINFHGIDEGAPLPDIYNSARIFFKLLVNTIENH